MKQAFLGLTIMAIALALAGCGQKTASSTTTTAQGTGALSTEAELVVGTMKLEDTDLAVTAEQAKTLLPLWQTYQTLASSSTSATEEMNALVDQIKSAMTTQQVEKITALKLTQQDMLTVMTDAGLSLGGPSGTPNPNATPGANQQFFQGPQDSGNGGGGPSFSTGGGAPPSGSGPSGSPPSGGGNAPSGGFVIQGDNGGPGGGQGQSSTPQAVRGNAFANRIPGPLLNALIEMLKKKAG
jgi:hypothetical protein